jgi:hypothetical protein
MEGVHEDTEWLRLIQFGAYLLKLEGYENCQRKMKIPSWRNKKLLCEASTQ